MAEAKILKWFVPIVRSPTSGCSRIATARFFNRSLLAVSVVSEFNLACPQSAEPQALGRSSLLIRNPASLRSRVS
jgi:hypothetical protein